MLATPHALIGALLAVKLKDPAIGLPVAFFSHFLFDLVPHWDWGWHPHETVSRIANPSKKTRILLESTVDVLVGFVLCYLLFVHLVPFWYLVAMIIAAQGPDWISTPYYLFHWKFFPIPQIKELQHRMQLHAVLPWGILNQAAAVILFAIFMQYVPVFR